MKARIERDWASLAAKVWFYEASEIGTRVLRPSDGGWSWEAVEHGQSLPDPSLKIPEDALQELVREASNILPAEDATTKHLNDAIGVRDRLLTIVEKRRG